MLDIFETTSAGLDRFFFKVKDEFPPPPKKKGGGGSCQVYEFTLLFLLTGPEVILCGWLDVKINLLTHSLLAVAVASDDGDDE